MDNRRRWKIIVGIDPGTTVGLAIVDLDGKLVFLKSKKGWSLEGVVSAISDHGRPIVVSTDKSSPPEFVRRISASFGSILFSPDEDINLEFKRDIARKYKTENDHERDALASAIYAYKRVRPKIEKIRSVMREREPEVIERVLKGEKISSAVNPLEEKKIADEISTLRKELEKSNKKVMELKARLKAKPKVLVVRGKRTSREKILEARVNELEKEVSEERHRLDEMSKLLELSIKGDIDVFYKTAPSNYVILAKFGNVVFAREKQSNSEIDERHLEKLVKEYRNRKKKSLEN